MIRRGRRGNLCVFLCLVMSAVMLVFGTLLYAARLRAAENDLSRAMSAQIRTTLAGYDPECREFGLFGFTAGDIDAGVFSDMLPLALRGCKMNTTFQIPLTGAAVLDRQISRYMKGRLPAVYAELLVSRLAGFRQGIDTTGNAMMPLRTDTDSIKTTQSTGGSVKSDDSDLQSLIDSAIGGLTEKEIESTAGSLFGDALKELKDQLLIKLQDDYRRYAADLLGASSEVDADDVPGKTPDFLDPTSLSTLAGQIDNLLDFKTAPIYEKICLVEYVLGHFRPAVQKISSASGVSDLLTLSGHKFIELPESRQNEVEQILTGVEKPEQARLIVQSILTGLRGIIRLIWILSDTKQMNDLRAAGTAISAAALALSSGSVVVDAEVVTYLLVIGQAIGGGMADCDNLAAGRAVNLWPGRTDVNISLYYQDYLRIFLLAVPRSTLLQRIGCRLDDIMPEARFTELKVSTEFRNSIYSLTGSYNGQ